MTTRHLEGAIVESVYSGYCGRDLVESVLELTPTVMREVPGALWLLDLSKATGSDSDAHVPGRKLLQVFRAGGGRAFATVVERPGLRMLLSAVAVAARLPMKIFDSRDAALAWLRLQQRTPRAA